MAHIHYAHKCKKKQEVPPQKDFSRKLGGIAKRLPERLGDSMSILESPLKINSIVLKNRLVFPPMGTEMADWDGKSNERLLHYYESRAQGGFSLIIVEHSFVSQQGKASERQLSSADDSQIDGLRKIAQVIQKSGAKAVLQINHAGAHTSRFITGEEPVSASPITSGNGQEVSRPLSEAEIHRVVSDFVNAAVRAKKAGFDGVEIHSAHSYLLNQFYSPYFNNRRDRYGGSLSNRIRIHLEMIEAIRHQVGRDYPLFLRLGACDYIPGGTTMEDSIAAAQEFEKAGLDVLDISGGVYGFMVPGHTAEEGWFSDVTQELKKHISLPVILTGGIRHLQMAEKFLENGNADLIGIGRPVYQDPSWLQKAWESWRNQ